jgi:hypothetical protein
VELVELEAGDEVEEDEVGATLLLVGVSEVVVARSA